MSLNEHLNTRQYTKYKRHVNESHERVDAKTVNKIQEDVSAQQKQANEIKDKAFEERVYTIFNNNMYTNAMFIDYYKNGEYLDQNKSKDAYINPYKGSLTIKKDSEKCSAVSTVIHSVHGIDIQLNDFFLIANEVIPVGSTIKYYLETKLGERWPIPANSLKLPMHLTEPLSGGFRIIIEMSANSLWEFPELNGYAILYWDAQVEKNYGLTNPDLMRFP